MKRGPGLGEAVLSVSHVDVSYWRRTGMFRRERFWPLRDVSFDLGHGETLGIIGRNGVGKSTLLRVLAGIIAPDKGQVARNGCRASLLSLQVGFIPYLTGRENAILSGMLLGLRRSEIQAKLEEIIAFAELEDFIDEPVRTYSSGMAARLGFAVAFQADPDVLLVDEVLGVGDVAFQQKSAAAMREKMRSSKTVVLVFHNAQLIKGLCDRAVWIENGVMRAEGETERVLAAYHEALQLPATRVASAL